MPVAMGTTIVSITMDALPNPPPPKNPPEKMIAVAKI